MVDVQLMGVGCGGVMIMKGMVRTMADLASGVIGSVAQVAAFGHVAMGNVAQSCSGHSLSASWTHLLHINGRMSPSYLHGHKMGTSAYVRNVMNVWARLPQDGHTWIGHMVWGSLRVVVTTRVEMCQFGRR